MTGLFRFLASSAGRWVRIIAGLILIALGIWAIEGAWGWVVGIIGLAPLAAGVFDFCIFAPLFGLPFTGERLRAAVSGG